MGHNAVWSRHFSAEKQEQTIAHELCFCSATVPNIATVLNLLMAQLFVARDVLDIATVVNLLAAVCCTRILSKTAPASPSKAVSIFGFKLLV